MYAKYNPFLPTRNFLAQLSLLELGSIEDRYFFWRSYTRKTDISPRFHKGFLFSTVQTRDHSLYPGSSSIFIDPIDACIIVTLNGTQEGKAGGAQISNYVTLRKSRVPWAPQTTAQRGFLKLYIEQSQELMKEVFDALNQHEGYDLIFTGYSLGGGLCQLAAWHFLALCNADPTSMVANVPNIKIVSFGAPRTWTPSSVREFNKTVENTKSQSKRVEIYRYQVKEDHIPSLPPKWAGFLDNVTEEMADDTSAAAQGAYSDYKFVDKQELET
ncbi:MAG: hypothetical protein EOP45_21040 [Sphingobacteriaceae bacterium]|nr:MAG: hypothetical protein EOP45_21040 [Sphingobacteriaceae bacterium]